MVPQRARIASDVEYVDLGFSTWEVTVRPFARLHSHNEVEMGVIERGSATAIFGEQQVEIPENRLCFYWAANPHGPIQAAPDTRVRVIFVPLAWFLQFRLPPRFVQDVLHGKVFMSSSQRDPCSDVSLLKHWGEYMESGSQEKREIVLLEFEARLRRLALETGPLRPRRTSPAAAAGETRHLSTAKFEQIASTIARRYQEELSVTDIAAVVDLNPIYAMRLFRKACGMTILDFLTRQRISHAQRLLATTDRKILDIGLDSGFNSTSRFYAAFGKLCGKSPAEYRVSIRKPREASRTKWKPIRPLR